MKEAISNTADLAGLQTLQSIASATSFNAWMYQTIRPYIKGRVLELGSGIGNISDQLVSEFSAITLSDYNPAYCEYLVNRFQSTKQVEAVLSIDLQDPAFFETNQPYQNSFDTIILLNVIEHLANDRQCVHNCSFLLRNGGHLIVLAPAYRLLYSALDKEIGHYRRYTKNGLARLLAQNGFGVVQKQYFNLMGIGGWLFFNKLLGRKVITKGSMKNFDRLVPLARWLDRAIGHRLGLSAIVVGKKTGQPC